MRFRGNKRLSLIDSRKRRVHEKDNRITCACGYVALWLCLHAYDDGAGAARAEKGENAKLEQGVIAAQNERKPREKVGFARLTTRICACYNRCGGVDAAYGLRIVLIDDPTEIQAISR